MSILLFSLRGVPDDEAEEVRQLLDDNKIEFYETSAGNWGISMPAIWLREQHNIESAQQLLGQYQHNRMLTQQQLYQQRQTNGEIPSLFSSIFTEPLRFIFYLIAIALVLYASVKLLWDMGL